MGAFETLKATCTKACHIRNACAEGYKQMLASENVSQMMATWRNNWEDVTTSKFADIMVSELPKQYPDLKEDMNQAGIYLNECPEDARMFVRVIVTAATEPIHVYGDAQAYVLDTAKVVAHDHSQVYNTRAPEATVFLLDYSYGNVSCGQCTAQNRSRLNISGTAVVTLNGSIDCHATGGTIIATGYRRIDACGETIVYACNGQSIYLEGNAFLQPITSYNDNEQQ